MGGRYAERSIAIPRKVSSKISEIWYMKRCTGEEVEISLNFRDFLAALPRLGFVETGKLLFHESVAPKKIEQRKAEFRSDGVWGIPCVDAAMGVSEDDYYLIMDGHHKTTAAMECNFAVVPVCLHTYEEVRLGTWLPVVSNIKNSDLEGLGVDGRRASFEAGMEMLRARRAYFIGAKNRKDCFVFDCEPPISISAVVENQNALIKRLGGHDIDFIKDNGLSEQLESGDGNLVLIRNPFRPEDIWNVGRVGRKTGLRMPEKATRHNLDPRMRLIVSTDLLKDAEKARQELARVVDYAAQFMAKKLKEAA